MTIQPGVPVFGWRRPVFTPFLPVRAVRTLEIIKVLNLDSMSAKT